MLYQFLEAHRNDLLQRVRGKLEADRKPPPTEPELEDIVVAFFDVLVQQLRRLGGAATGELIPVERAAARHGAELQALGVEPANLVHDYGAVCSAVTDMAIQSGASISPEEFHCLNVTLDNAMAAAITEYSRSEAQDRRLDQEQHLDFVATELRNLSNSAALAFSALKRSGLGPESRTGAVLGRALERQRDLVDSMHHRVQARASRQVELIRFPVRGMVEEAATMATQHLGGGAAKIEIGEMADSSIEGDRARLVSALADLIENATGQRGAGAVHVVATFAGDQVLIDIDGDRPGLTTIRFPAKKKAA